MDRAFERYEVLPSWAKVALFPLLLPIVWIYATAGMTIALVFFVPYLSWSAWWEDRQFRRHMQRSGRTASWHAVGPMLASGKGSLLVEVGPKGPGYGWWVEGVEEGERIPKLHEFLDRGHEAYRDFSTEAMVRLREELTDRFGETALLVTHIPADAFESENLPRDRVLAILGGLQRRR